MPVDYSKWDALELSDDSDIEVHPNVDKRSFIRAKQNQIHQDRTQRRQQIEIFKYERIVNDGLIVRISSLLSALKAHASEAASRNPGEVAFQAVMEWAKSGKDDKPPAPPEGLLSAADDQPTYSKMMITLLDQVNKAVDEKKPDDRYKAMLEEVQGHEVKVRKLQAELIANLETLQKEEGKKITSEAYHDGFSSSHVAKSQPGESTGQASRVELLNPNMPPTDSLPAKDSGVEVDEDDEVQSSAAGEKFGSIGMSDYQQSLQFLTQNPQLLIERETDGLLVKAFDAALEKKEDLSRQYVHQALLLQYCRALGRDGVGIFFKRITTKGHQAQEVFYKDVQETYMRIKNRSREIIAERAKEGTEGVEQIQLHAMEPGQVIQIKIPPADSEDVEAQEAREIFEGFEPDMKKALATGDLDQVNEVLGRMKVDEAEELVNLLGQAGVLSVEEELIDATTEEGQQQLKSMEAAAAADRAAEKEARTMTEDPE